MIKDREYYDHLFQDYPDLVSTAQFRQMLNGIGDSFARKLIHEKRVQAFYVKPSFFIVKSSIIEYVLSSDYLKRNLKVRI